MLRNILVATDLSPPSDAAVARACQLAADFSAKLSVLHIVNQCHAANAIDQEKELAISALEKQISDFRSEIEINIFVKSGNAVEQIERTASEWGCDLIIIGRHHKQFPRDMFISSTVERVISRAVQPVLLVKNDATQPYHKIAIAVDGSEPSATAVRVVKMLGLLNKSDVRVVHAHQPFAKKLVDGHSEKQVMSDYVHSEMALAREDVVNFLKSLGYPDIASMVHVYNDNPISALRRFIERKGTDLLVLGTNARSALARFVLGSVTREALHNFDIDVLIVPPATMQ